jgi:stage V sporulation protein R
MVKFMSDSVKVTSGQEWTFDLIEEMFEHIQDIAHNEFGLNTYSNQLETITAEQMLDAYCSVGMPIFYPHWSFGEQFIKQAESYKRGEMGLAYEIVINADPCIAYLMEENTMGMQTLVIAHACFGHNHFFKNNYLFKQWTDAEGIVDYLVFAKKYIMQCEEKYGIDEVEKIIDAAHSLQQYGVDKYKHPEVISAKKEEALRQERETHIQSQLNELWNTIPKTTDDTDKCDDSEEVFPSEPQENILQFIENNAPRLKEWHREIIRIIRRTAQYFYPQGQTQLMNEGFATYCHYKTMHRLHEKGLLSDGAMLEFYKSHTSVIFQPTYDDRRFSGINPYALGFAMMQDIERVATNPTTEDYEWFGKHQDWVGSGDPWSAIKFAAANFKDESFIKQYLSPKIMRDFHLFSIHDDSEDTKLEVTAIHNKAGYSTIRDLLSKQYNYGYKVPDIQVTNVHLWSDRSLWLQHTMVNERPIDTTTAVQVLKYLEFLWGYDVHMVCVDSSSVALAHHTVSGDKASCDIFLSD